MAAVSGSRLRWGAVAWLLTLQFFVVETVTELRFQSVNDVPYSRADVVISLLGTGISPLRLLMNGSFVVQGLLIAAGAVLLRPLLRGTGGRLATALLVASGVGVVLVGLFPMDGVLVVHRIGAALHLVAGALGLICLAYGVRPRSEALGTVLALLGLLSTGMTVFFITGVVLLGEGGTERAAAYLLPIALALAGAALWRMGPDGAGGDAADRRAEERAERARRAQERDQALEAAAARAAAARQAPARPEPAADAARGTDDGDDDFDPDDPWATPRPRRED
ncbi:DUF998 domain-containing protein [Blastococcus sp. SYSU D00820]